MLTLIETDCNGDRDIYEFDDETDDSKKYVYVEWAIGSYNVCHMPPRASNHDTMVSHMVELELRKIGRQHVGDTLRMFDD